MATKPKAKSPSRPKAVAKAKPATRAKRYAMKVEEPVFEFVEESKAVEFLFQLIGTRAVQVSGFEEAFDVPTVPGLGFGPAFGRNDFS